MRLSILSLIVLLAAASAQTAAGDHPPARSEMAGESAHAPVQQQTPKMANLMGQPKRGWWNDWDAGLIGGIGGTIFGLLGGLIGTLAGFGKARRFVFALIACLVGFGAVSLVAGVIALVLGQPYAVYYPLLLGGLVLTAVCGGIRPALRQGYEQRELRRMAAMDAGLMDSQRKQQP